MTSCSSNIVSIPQQAPSAREPSNLAILSLKLQDTAGNPINPSQAVIRVANSQQTDRGLKTGPCVSHTPEMAVWVEGYEVGIKNCGDDIVTLKALDAEDNVAYVWNSVRDCNYCHGSQLGSGYDEVNEWFRSGHAKGLQSRYLETMYLGTDMSYRKSPDTKWKLIGNELVKSPPVIDQNYFGPGYKLDYPESPGDCSYCHVPALISASQASEDLEYRFTNRGAIWEEGITCDVCHKVFDVTLDDAGFPFANRPGILSFRLMRPRNGNLMLGPFAKFLASKQPVARNHEWTCTTVFSQSEFCAPCHYGKFGDMVIFNSYGEWKQSKYAAEGPEYRTCQDCHMSHLSAEDKIPRWQERQACTSGNTPDRNFDHNVMDFGPYPPGSQGNEIPRMVKHAAAINVDFRYQPDKSNALDVFVTAANTQAGHNFPTDSPLRHLILVVEAKDRSQTPLIQVGGDRVPNWAGPTGAKLDENKVKDYGGLPGKIFANLLVEEDTNIWPSAAYWNETKFTFEGASGGSNSDNRLRPGQSDVSAYSFSIPDAGTVTFTIKLVYRYAFYDLMVQKGWNNRSDITVTAVQCEGLPTEPVKLKLSCRQIE